MRLFLFLFTITSMACSQTISDCKYRFNTYLNFNGSISNHIKFNKESIQIYNNNGTLEFTAYANELPMLSKVFQNYSVSQQENFYKTKGNKQFNKRRRDSIQIYMDEKKSKNNSQKQLQGLKIAIDAGHLAASFTEAMAEQKFLYFVKDSILHPTDTVKLFEGKLTYQTALILKAMLEEKGVELFLTRKSINVSSFGCNYNYWFKHLRLNVLDSLLSHKHLTPLEHKKLLKLDEYHFFWEFFRDYELKNRARLINEFKPDLSIIIHYNVDEKNVPWKKTSPNNYTMAFIGGCYTADKLNKSESKMNFLRLLFTNQLNQSEKLSELTVNQFHQNLKIPKATLNDADYLKNNCLQTKSDGVYCRQLVLCNVINSPLIYGESLYQDNEKECDLLMDNSKTYYGVETNERVYMVAKSYFNAILNYFGQ